MTDNLKNNAEIQEFIEELSNVEVDKVRVLNQYHVNDNCPHFFTTKMNLLFYLTQMKEKNPKTIFVGEAAGRKGCALTGIPFTSLQVISKKNKFGLFGFKEDFKESLQKESTATMIWSILEDLDFYPLLWNAYPFNPLDSKTRENRKPDGKELVVGSYFVRKIANIFIMV